MSSWLWQRGMGRSCCSHLSRSARGDGDSEAIAVSPAAWIGGSHADSFDGSASGQERQILRYIEKEFWKQVG